MSNKSKLEIYRSFDMFINKLRLNAIIKEPITLIYFDFVLVVALYVWFIYLIILDFY